MTLPPTLEEIQAPTLQSSIKIAIFKVTNEWPSCHERLFPNPNLPDISVGSDTFFLFPEHPHSKEKKKTTKTIPEKDLLTELLDRL